VGVVTLNPAGAEPLEVINEAERLSMAQDGISMRAQEDAIATVW